MATVTFTVDFGEPDGDLEDFGLAGDLYDGPPITCADDIMAQFKAAGHDLAEALEGWGLLDSCKVTIKHTPDIPEEARPYGPRTFDRTTYDWIQAHSTTAVWEEV